MDTEELAERPAPLTPERLGELAPFLPDGATLLGGLPTATAAGYQESGDCVIVIYAADDHTIHHVTMCGSGSHYELSGDHVTGHW
jgi:hypothetical protein